MIPRPVLDALEQRDGAPIGARNARIDRHRCGALTLLGLDEDVCAFTARADLEPVTSDGELAALIDGRATYMLERAHARGGRRLRLTRRDRWIIAGQPPEPGRRYDVLVEHRCGQPITQLAPSNLT